MTTIRKVLRNALILSKIRDFYRHWGINVCGSREPHIGIIDLAGRYRASTLTMQLARNLFLSPDRSFHRKIQEALLAIQIERRLPSPNFTFTPTFFSDRGIWI